MDDDFEYALALTGGIASGKSTVCSILKIYGYLTIDADEIAHSLLNIHHEEIAKMFGKQYVENKKVLRKELGKIIFSQLEQKLKLENFLHPKIKTEIIKQARIFKKAKKTYFIDIPLFFERRHYNIDKSLIIYAPYDVQVKRLEKRDKISEQEAKLKISNQMDIEKKKKLATYIIDNSKDLKSLQKSIDTFIEELNRDLPKI